MRGNAEPEAGGYAGGSEAAAFGPPAPALNPAYAGSTSGLAGD
jgi:hypothetical protein